jgi:hypothetical protein
MKELNPNKVVANWVVLRVVKMYKRSGERAALKVFNQMIERLGLMVWESEVLRAHIVRRVRDESF